MCSIVEYIVNFIVESAVPAICCVVRAFHESFEVTGRQADPIDIDVIHEIPQTIRKIARIANDGTLRPPIESITLIGDDEFVYMLDKIQEAFSRLVDIISVLAE